MSKFSYSSQKYLVSELVLLYLILPVMLALPIDIYFKLLFAFSAIVYCGVLGRKMKLFQRAVLLNLTAFQSQRNLFIRFITFASLSTLAMWVFYPERFFYVVLNQPALWFGISLFYSVFSVYPQEFLYRTLFFERYKTLLSNNKVFILLNALLFCLAHLMFYNALVLVLTFFGGILFAYTYHKTKSLVTVSIEHSLYGLWLYTIGIGHLLAFPG